MGLSRPQIRHIRLTFCAPRTFARALSPKLLSLGLEGGGHHRLHQILKGQARSLRGGRHERSLSKAGDGVQLQDPRPIRGVQDNIHPPEAAATKGTVGLQRNPLHLFRHCGLQRGRDVELRLSRSVAGFKIVEIVTTFGHGLHYGQHPGVLSSHNAHGQLPAADELLQHHLAIEGERRHHGPRKVSGFPDHADPLRRPLRRWLDHQRQPKLIRDEIQSVFGPQRPKSRITESVEAGSGGSMLIGCGISIAPGGMPCWRSWSRSSQRDRPGRNRWAASSSGPPCPEGWTRVIYWSKRWRRTWPSSVVMLFTRTVKERAACVYPSALCRKRRYRKGFADWAG